MIVPFLSGMAVSLTALIGAWLIGLIVFRANKMQSPSTQMIMGVLARMILFLSGFLILKQLFDESQLKVAILSGVGCYFLLSLGPWFLKSLVPSRIR